MKRAILALAASVLVSAADLPASGFQLPSGLTVSVRSDLARPLVRITLRLDLPAALSEPDLRLLGAALARGGAGPHSAEDVQRQRAAEGHVWTFERQDGALVWSVLADSQDQEGAAELLAHAVVRPGLYEGWHLLQKEAAEPSGRAALHARLTSDPAHWVLPQGSTLPRLLALGQAVLRPERATLAFQGDVTSAQARQLALLQFGTWRPSPSGPLPEPPPQADSSRVLVAPSLEGRALHLGLALGSRPGGLPMAQDLLLAHRLRGLFHRQAGYLIHRRSLSPSEGYPQALQALLREVERRLSLPPGAGDLRILNLERATAALHQRLEPSQALQGLPEPIPLERMGPLLAYETVRDRLVALLEGAGPEDQASLGDLGLGPVQRFNR